MHLQLIAAHLLRHNVEFALLKRDLQHRVKEEAIAKFQVRIQLLKANLHFEAWVALVHCQGMVGRQLRQL